MLRPIRLAALLLALAPAAARATDGTCARDLLVAQSSQKMAIERLESLGDSEADRCRGWRQHVDTMRRAAVVYGRCLTGAERSERLAQVQGSEREFAALVRSRCR
ncbi:hypothetical protein [Methylobacterium isbiliense]|jgi:hypothetical protein|uniref:Lysozyme inhibitor LprI N-terminal domain-containing protein n=1 Tax=Methylobacterium isbiliense TaxID=315478 RepID=A0ABQ4SAX1_9HYPH|nr:hypothetical protein [Methylobacterium isbiliense]MDN3625983.1 hypothetical protein [Methylobacterium isbiliense]GJD99658.1 hypothetical protein GMJLKIPL_1576 [Methylobacterium isbiliense]